MTRTLAVLSDDRRYRFSLLRLWSANPVMTFVMLNPSTADENTDDPTIRRCVGFARREDCGGIAVVNLFPLRVTRPVHLWDGTMGDPNGPEGANRAAVGSVLDNPVGPVVAAWGALPWNRLKMSAVFDIVKAVSPLMCFGRTKNGAPRHPLYLPLNAPLEVWG